jgi:hypothetical protein
MMAGEVQRALNQKVGSKPSRAIDFASRFVLLINIRTNAKNKYIIHSIINMKEI